MVNIVIASHSRKLAEGLKEVAGQMGPDVKISATGGTADGALGSDFEDVSEKIKEGLSSDGLLVFFDLGSSMMNCQMVLEGLSDDEKEKTYLVGAPFVESCIEATVLAQTGTSFEEIVKTLKDYKFNKLD